MSTGAGSQCSTADSTQFLRMYCRDEGKEVTQESESEDDGRGDSGQDTGPVECHGYVFGTLKVFLNYIHRSARARQGETNVVRRSSNTQMRIGTLHQRGKASMAEAFEYLIGNFSDLVSVDHHTIKEAAFAQTSL